MDIKLAAEKLAEYQYGEFKHAFDLNDDTVDSILCALADAGLLKDTNYDIQVGDVYTFENVSGMRGTYLILNTYADEHLAIVYSYYYKNFTFQSYKYIINHGRRVTKNIDPRSILKEV